MSNTKDAFRFELFGVKELMDALEQLPTMSMRKAAVRNAAKRALKPTAELYQSALPWAPKPKQYAKSRHLRDSVEITSALKRSQKKDGRRVGKDEIVMYVGSSAPHAHLLEWGTEERQHKEAKAVTIGRFAGSAKYRASSGKVLPKAGMGINKRWRHEDIYGRDEKGN